MEANISSTQLWLADLDSTNNRRASPFIWGVTESNACWHKDGKHIVFLSDRGGSMQIWLVDTVARNLLQLSRYPIPLFSLHCAPNSDYIAVAAQVFPGKTMAQTAELMEQYVKGKVYGYGKLDARLYSKLFVRHWDEWRDGRRNHIFLVPWLTGTTIGTAWDLAVDWDVDFPTRPFGGRGEWSFAPDSSAFSFTRRMSCDGDVCNPAEEGSNVAWSDNLDICTVTPADNSKWTAPSCISTNPAIDTDPRYSPTDPTIMAHVRTSNPGYENSKRQLVVSSNGGDGVVYLKEWPYSVGQVEWAADGKKILFTAEVEGVINLYSVDNGNTKAAEPDLFHSGNYTCSDINPTVSGDVIAIVSSMSAPANILLLQEGIGSVPITTFNSALLSSVQLSPVRDRAFIGAANDTVHMWIVPPPTLVEGHQYPVALLIHGGPQNAWIQFWSYEWNPQLFASAGYFTVLINFHGSSGYGQDFVDSITMDWGGKPFQDQYLGLEAALADEEYGKYMDATRCVALGASFGGYMVNWINGNMDEFRSGGQGNQGLKALVTQDGVLDNRAMYYHTEELWWPEHDMGGAQFAVPDNYEKYNPLHYISRWSTPTLIVHGGRDYRLPETVSTSIFNALQRQGKESKFLYLPEENHHIENPVSVEFWMDNVLGFINGYVGEVNATEVSQLDSYEL